MYLFARYIQIVARTLDLRRLSLLDLVLAATIIELRETSGSGYMLLAVLVWFVVSAICRALAEAEIVE